MTSPAVKTPEEIRKGLRPVRWLRTAAVFGLSFPVLLTAAIVLIHKVGGGKMGFFVSGAPWTHRFWDTLFYLFVAGTFFSLLNLARVCPRCGQGFFRRSGWNPRRRPPRAERNGWTTWINVNVFGRKCLNCGLRLDGANADEKFATSNSEDR